MDDLRSLEGVGSLLSQQMSQKTHGKKSHKRSTSVPKITSTGTTNKNVIAISALIPSALATALQHGINIGYHQNTLTEPQLFKSHSGFGNFAYKGGGDEPMPSFVSPPQGPTSEMQNVVSPSQSLSPPLSPTTLAHLRGDHAYGGGGGLHLNPNINFNTNSHSNSNHSIISNGTSNGTSSSSNNVNGYSTATNNNSATAIATAANGGSGGSGGTPSNPPSAPPSTSMQQPFHNFYFNHVGARQPSVRRMSSMASSPSFRLGSIRGRSSLKLDFNEIMLDMESIGGTSRQTSLALIESNETDHSELSGLTLGALHTISSPEVIEYDEEKAPPFPLRKTYSNQSIFALYSGDDMDNDKDKDKGDQPSDVDSNTFVNSQIPADCIPTLEDKNGTHSNAEIEILNFKEDFFEYTNIGNGASGIVSKAFHFRSCKMVAIKQCRSKQAAQMDAFKKEADIYARLEDCPYIINVLGFGKDKENGLLAMALEYMDLASVDTLAIARCPSLDMRTRELAVGHIMQSVLRALSVAHEHLWVHNDVKPANILANQYGDIRLSDFGTALRLKNSHCRLSKNCGTQRYQPPEKMIVQPLSYGTKCDIWSLGVTAYELLFGDDWGNKDDAYELAYVNKPPTLSPKTHHVSAECCDFISQCLTTDDVLRPSADELIDHAWFAEHVETVMLREKWPWLITIEEEEDAIASAIDTLGINAAQNKKKKAKNGMMMKNQKTTLPPPPVLHQTAATPTNVRPLYNEELIFMISALILYYATQHVDLDNDDADYVLHRRVSNFNDGGKMGRVYSDEERIENMSKFAYCSKQMVLDRIRVTVSYIKSQINKH